jgi:cytidyltransferase-like protein
MLGYVSPMSNPSDAGPDAEGRGSSPSYAIVSGYFNPLHVGHLDLMESGRALAAGLIVIVNNDEQQLRKKGRIIQDEAARLRIVQALRVVDQALVAVDDDGTVCATLEALRAQHPEAELVFGNGGDRSSPETTPEAEVCARLGIRVVYGVGGEAKADASSRIIAALDEPDLPS